MNKLLLLIRKYGEERPMEVPGLAIFHIEQGRITELWQTFDMVNYNRQLGLVK